MSSDVRDTLRFLQTENARLQENNRDLKEENTILQRVLKVLETLLDLSNTVNAETSVIGLLDRILESALTAIDATAGSLLLIDEDTHELVFTVVHGASSEKITNFRLPPGTGLVGWVAQNGKPVIIANARNDPRFSPTVDEQFGFSTHSFMCAPLATPRKIMGVLTALNKSDGNEFKSADLALLVVVAQLSALTMERAENAIPVGSEQ